MSWCEKLLQEYHQEGYNQHEIIIKLRYLCTSLWIDYKKLKEFLIWLEKKRIQIAVMKDCFIHDFIVLELFGENKLITSCLLESCTKSILSHLSFRFEFVHFCSKLSNDIHHNDENFSERFRELIFGEYNRRRSGVCEYVRTVLSNRCLLIGEYQITDDVPLISPIIEMLKGKVVVDLLSELPLLSTHLVDSYFQGHSDNEIFSLVSLLVDLQSSYLLQSYPFKVFGEIYPIFSCHAFFCEVFRYLLDPSKHCVKDILGSDIVEILSCSCGIIFCLLKLFPYFELQMFLDRNLVSIIPILPNSICEDMAQIIVDFLMDDVESSSLLLNYLLSVIDRHFGFAEQHFHLCFDDNILDDRELNTQTVDLHFSNVFARNPSFDLSQYHFFLVATSCSHTNQIFPAMTISHILLRLLLDQKLHEFDKIVQSLFSHPSRDLNIVVLFISLLFWWSSVKDRDHSCALHTCSHILTHITVLYPESSSLILINAIRNSQMLQKWCLSLDILHHKFSNLRQLAEHSEQIVAYLIISLSSDLSPWSNEKLYQFVQKEICTAFTSRNLLLRALDLLSGIVASDPIFSRTTISNILSVLKKLLQNASDSITYDCVAISITTIETACLSLSNSSRLSSSRYQNIPSNVSYFEQVVHRAQRVLQLQTNQSSESTDQFVGMITEFCNKGGLYRFTAEHLVNIFGMLPPSSSPIAVTSKAFLLRHENHPTSNLITSLISEVREDLSALRVKEEDSDGSRNLYPSISGDTSGHGYAFKTFDLMTCGLVPASLTTHEQTVGHLISLDSLIPYSPDKLSILILPPEYCIYVTPLRLELLLSLPNLESSDSTFIPDLVSRTIMCLHSLVSCSLLRCNFEIPSNLSNTVLSIDQDLLSIVQSHRHSILFTVIHSSFPQYLLALFSFVRNDSTTLPVAYLSLKYVFVCLTLMEHCFSPEDACLSLVETFLFDQQIIFFMVSFVFTQNSGKYFVLSILVQSLSILEAFPIQTHAYFTCVALLLSILQLYDQEKMQDEYSLEYLSVLANLMVDGKEILQRAEISSMRNQSSDIERISFVESNYVKSSAEVTPFHALTIAREGSLVEVFLSLASARKKKYCQNLEKITIEFIPQTANLLKSMNLSKRANLPFEVILKGFYISKCPVVSRNVNCLVQELQRLICHYQEASKYIERVVISIFLQCSIRGENIEYGNTNISMIVFRSLHQALVPHLVSLPTVSSLWIRILAECDVETLNPILAITNLFEIYTVSFGQRGVLFLSALDAVSKDNLLQSIKSCTFIVLQLSHYRSSESMTNSDEEFAAVLRSYSFVMMLFETILLFIQLYDYLRMEDDAENILIKLVSLCDSFIRNCSPVFCRRLRLQFQIYIDRKMIPSAFQKELWRILYSSPSAESSVKKRLLPSDSIEYKKPKKGGKLKVMDLDENLIQQTYIKPVEAISHHHPVSPSELTPIVNDDDEGTDTASMSSSTIIEAAKTTDLKLNSIEGTDVWEIDTTPCLIDKFNLSF